MATSSVGCHGHSITITIAIGIDLTCNVSVLHSSECVNLNIKMAIFKSKKGIQILTQCFDDWYHILFDYMSGFGICCYGEHLS